MAHREGLMDSLPAAHRERFAEYAREVAFPAGTRVFEEGGTADRLWIIRSGEVVLDVHVPGRRAPIVETLGPGELLGWSWLFPPYEWHLGARTMSPVRADEFDAARIRALCEEDPELGRVVTLHVAGVIAHRLMAARIRLLDLYGPHPGAAPRTWR